MFCVFSFCYHITVGVQTPKDRQRLLCRHTLPTLCTLLFVCFVKTTIYVCDHLHCKSPNNGAEISTVVCLNYCYWKIFRFADYDEKLNRQQEKDHIKWCNLQLLDQNICYCLQRLTKGLWLLKRKLSTLLFLFEWCHKNPTAGFEQ